MCFVFLHVVSFLVLLISTIHVWTTVKQTGYIRSHNLILVTLSTLWLDFGLYWIYYVSDKITPGVHSLTPMFFCLSYRWRRRWGRTRQIPRCRPPSALPIPLSWGPLPPPAPLPGTCHGYFPPEPPAEEDTLGTRRNFTCRCVCREALSHNLSLFLLLKC